MFFKRRPFIVRLLNAVPGKRFGMYRFMPVFFVLGAMLEFTMINWEAGTEKVNFYKTFKKRLVTEAIEEQQRLEGSPAKPE